METLDRFFDDFALYLDSWRNSRRQYNRYLAADFNMFASLAPNSDALQQLLNELLDPAAGHGQGHRFGQALTQISAQTLPSDPCLLSQEFLFSKDCQRWLKHCSQISDAPKLRWLLQDLHDWLKQCEPR